MCRTANYYIRTATRYFSLTRFSTDTGATAYLCRIPQEARGPGRNRPIMNNKLFLNRLKHFFFRVTGLKKTLTATTDKYGLQFSFDLNDGIGTDIYYRYGVYVEDFITEFLNSHLDLQKDDLIIDIGANIGWYSLVLSQKAQPLIYAFEPEPRNYAYFTRNLKDNHCTNVVAVNAAVDNTPGEMQLHLYKNHNQGRHSFIRHAKSVGTVAVKTIVLDTFLKEKGAGDRPVKFLKIDIEGYEYNALRGAVNTLKHTEHVLSEFSPGIMKSNNESAEAYAQFMADLGFIPYEITRSGIQPAALNAMLAAPDNVYNIFWSRKKW